MREPSKARLFTNTITGLILVLSAGAVYTFSLYSQALRNQQSYSAIGAQYIYNFGILGYSFAGIAAGYILNHRNGGPGVALAIGAAFSIPGLLVMSLGIRGVFNCPAELLWILAFPASIGQGISYTTGIVVNTSNFHQKHRGKIVGLTMAFFSLSPSFYSLIWDRFFVKDASDFSVDSQSVENYFWFMTAFFGGVCVFSALTFRILWDPDVIEVERAQEIRDQEETEKRLLGQTEGQTEEESEEISKEIDFKDEEELIRQTTAALTLRDVLPMTSFISVLFMYSVFKGVDKTYLGDIGKIGESLQFDSLIAIHVSIQAVVSCGTRIITGFTFDGFKRWIPAWVFVEIGLSVMALMCFLFMFYLDVLFEYYLSTILFTLSNIVYAMTPAICANRFGKQNMGYAWGFVMTTGTLLTFAYGGWNSALYDKIRLDQAAAGGGGGVSSVCYGIQCFTTTFLIAGITVVANMLIFAVYGRDSQQREILLEKAINDAKVPKLNIGDVRGYKDVEVDFDSLEDSDPQKVRGK